MMGRAEVILSEKMLLVFRCFTNNLVLFGSLKAKQSILVSKIILIDPYVTSKRLAGQKTILVQSSCKFNFKSSLQHAGTRFNSKRSLQANITEISLFNVLAKKQVEIKGLCSFNNF